MELERIEEGAYNKWGHSHGACIYLSSVFTVSECSCFSVGYISRYLVLLIENSTQKSIFLRKAIIFKWKMCESRLIIMIKKPSYLLNLEEVLSWWLFMVCFVPGNIYFLQFSDRFFSLLLQQSWCQLFTFQQNVCHKFQIQGDCRQTVFMPL